jgi:Amt family ammonium transporter
MKKLLSTFALISFLCLNFLGMTSVSFADEATSVKASDAVTLVADATPAEKLAEAKDEPPAPTPNKGDTAWMIMATILVTLMVIPGLALFYGGLVRSKNMLSVLMQTFVVFSLMGVLWAIYGYSVAFTGGSPFYGGFSKLFLSGITPDSVGATFSKGVVIPEFIFVAFQLTFAAITPALIIGAFAEMVQMQSLMLNH